MIFTITIRMLIALGLSVCRPTSGALIAEVFSQAYRGVANGKVNHHHHHYHHDDGYSAYSHHDKIPPWWGNVSNDEGGNVSVSKTHHYELFFGVYIYQVSHATSGSFGMNFQIEPQNQVQPHFCLIFIVACGQEDNGASHLF